MTSVTIKLMIEITSDRSILHSTFVENFSIGLFPEAKALGAESGKLSSLFYVAFVRRLHFLVLRSHREQTQRVGYPAPPDPRIPCP